MRKTEDTLSICNSYVLRNATLDAFIANATIQKVQYKFICMVISSIVVYL